MTLYSVFFIGGPWTYTNRDITADEVPDTISVPVPNPELDPLYLGPPLSGPVPQAVKSGTYQRCTEPWYRTQHTYRWKGWDR